MSQDWFKCLQKKDEVVSAFVDNGKAEEAEIFFSSDWAGNLAESNKGSFFDQEQWLKELNEQPSAECDPLVSTSAFSASRSKTMVVEPLADDEIWKAKTLKHGKNSIATLSQPVKDCRRRSTNR